MPILGIIASSFRSAAGPEGAYDALATVTLSASTASITFAGIPTGYKHLQVRMIAQSSTTTEQYSPLRCELNSDSTNANYYTHRLFGTGSAASVGAQQFPYIAQIQDKYASANTFSGVVIDVLDYKDTNKYKTLRSLAGGDVNGTGGTIGIYSMLWKNTAAVTSITMSITGGTSPSFVQYSQFALYGIK